MVDHENEVQDLEQRARRLLGQLPLRSAPPTLERRVWSELNRLGSLPWWHRSFIHWPVGARAAFMLLSMSLSALTLLGSSRLLASVSPLGRIAGSFAWMEATARAFGSIARSIPSVWIYEIGIAGGLLYGTLFVLGAAAYRALYAAPLAEGPGK